MDIYPFVGSWNLVEAAYYRADGTAIYPYGKDAIGRIVYDAHGQMAVQIMRPGGLPFRANDITKGTLEETKAAFEGYLAYFGDYEVDEEQSTVTHKVKGSLFPNYIGQSLVRRYEISDKRLTLTTVAPALTRSDLVRGVLVWERS